MSVLQKLFAKRRDTEKKVAIDWQSLVAGVADGTMVDENEVDAVLTKLGRTPEQLASAIDVHRRVVEARELIDSETDSQSELGFLNEETERLKHELDAAIIALRKKYNSETANIQQRTGQLSQQLARIADARVFLMRQPKSADVAKRMVELKIQSDAELQKIADENSTLEAYRVRGILTPERYKPAMASIAAAESRLKAIQAEASGVEWGTLR